jgi:hypothetical protein
MTTTTITGAHLSNVDGGDRGSGFSRTLTLLVVWFFAALWIGVSGVAQGGAGKPPLVLAAAVTVPLLVFAADARFGWRLFRGLAHLGLPALIAMQTYRIGGVFFVVAWMNGDLPGAFALPAGLGDIAIGAAAPFVAAAVANGRPRARAIALGWSVLGVADLVVALFLGVTHSRSSLGVLATSVTTDTLAVYPFSLIPMFFVPLAFMLHALALRRLGGTA